MPYSPVTLKRAKTNNISTFTSYKKEIGSITEFDGIGIKVTEDIVAIDLDHYLDNGMINHQANQIIARFPTFYIEVSPSGYGLRLILMYSSNLGFNPKLHYHKKGNVEFYTSGTNRFVTLTGIIYQNGDIVENNDGVQWLL